MATMEIVHRHREKKPAPVRVNGVEIPRAAIAQEAQHHPASNAMEARHLATQALVVRELLLQEAKRLGMHAVSEIDADGRRATPDEAMIHELLERKAALPEIDEATCLDFYDRNRDRFRSNATYEVSHILVAANPGEPEERSRAAELADRLAKTLADRGQQAFSEAARLHSACSSAAHGGALGQVSTGQTTPEFERALADIAPGTTSSVPVETRFGFHVVRVEQRIDGRQLPFDFVKDRILDWLDERARHENWTAYVSDLASKAHIEGFSFGMPGIGHARERR